MSSMLKIFFFSIFSIFISISHIKPTTAQSSGALIELFGRAIEQDIRNKRARAERRRIKNEERERVIQLVKRVQIALKKLGFYKKRIDGDAGPGTNAALSRYIRAFNVSNFQFDQYHLQSLESVADSGFRSAQEMVDARTGGFDTATEMRRAKRAGFDRASTYRSARDAGISNRKAYDAFQGSGFRDFQEFKNARRAGFSSRRQRDAAIAVGFETRAEHQEFVKSGHEDKSSFIQAKRANTLFEHFQRACQVNLEKKNWLDALSACQSAISIKPENTVAQTRATQALNGSIKLAERLESRKSELVKKLMELNEPPQETETVEKKTKRELRQLKIKNEIAVNTKRLATFRGIQFGIACDDLIRRKNWQLAEKNCQRAKKALPNQPKWAEFAELASAEAKNEADKLAAKKALRAIQAKEEAEKLALIAAREWSTALLESIDKFSSDDGEFVNGIAIARALLSLRRLDDKAKAGEIEARTSDLANLVNKESDYSLYLEKMRKAEAVSLANAAAAAKEQAEDTGAFLLAFISENVTSKHIASLLEMSEQVDGALRSNSLERITLSNKASIALIGKLDLEQARQAFLSRAPKKSLAELDASNLVKAKNGLAITEGNRILLSGAAKDIVVLYNKSRTAPNVARNLLGNIIFTDGEALGCWYHTDRPETLRIRFLMNKLAQLGAPSAEVQLDCSETVMMQSDLVLMQRDAFLAPIIHDVG